MLDAGGFGLLIFLVVPSWAWRCPGCQQVRRVLMPLVCTPWACWAVKGLQGTYRDNVLRVHFCVGRQLKPVCGCCFPAVVNINEAVGARPSRRPGLPQWEGMEIMLCTLDRALNLASEAAVPGLPRETWA